MSGQKAEAKTVTADPPRSLRAWFGLLGPPVVWAIQLQTVYLTSEWACYAMDLTWNHVASVIALAGSVLALLTAYGEWRSVGGGTDDEASDPNSRRRFMAIAGVLSGALFTALIFATWLPTLTGVPCGK